MEINFAWNKKAIVAGLFVCLLLPIVFISGCVQQKWKETETEVTLPKIGQAFEINKMLLTVNEIETTDRIVDKSFGDSWEVYRSNPDYKFVKTYLTLENPGMEEETPDIGRVKIEVDKGYVYNDIGWLDLINNHEWNITEEDMSSYYCKRISFFSSILPTESESGCIYFEIPKDTQPTLLTFTVTGFPLRYIVVSLT